MTGRTLHLQDLIGNAVGLSFEWIVRRGYRELGLDQVRKGLVAQRPGKLLGWTESMTSLSAPSMARTLGQLAFNADSPCLGLSAHCPWLVSCV